MGASSSKLPVTSKFTHGEENDRIKYAASSMQGWRPYMEDTRAAILDLDGSNSTSFFGVYDGHKGASVAQYCADRFHIELANDEDYQNNLFVAIERMYFRIDEQLQEIDDWRSSVKPHDNIDLVRCAKTTVGATFGANCWFPPKELEEILGCDMEDVLYFFEMCHGLGSDIYLTLIVISSAWFTELEDKCFFKSSLHLGYYHTTKIKTAPYKEGSTACVAVIRGNQIFVGNAGDSRCVLSRNGQATDLSIDHKPNDQTERYRIEKAGGKVVKDGILKGLFSAFYKIQRGAYRVNGILSISRGIGDFALKKNKKLLPAEQMVTCSPGIHLTYITDDTEFLLIASDGIWKVKGSQNVVDFVKVHLQAGETDLRRICERLLDWCLGSGDNSTVILVQFKPGAWMNYPPPPFAPSIIFIRDG